LNKQFYIEEKDALNNGIELGNMQSKLLEKIEELTLYIIKKKIIRH